jgi:hypothetical protein
MYKEINIEIYGGQQKYIIRDNGNDSFTSFLADPANPNYAQFKKDILDGAELLDADGNPMTAEQVKEYVKELP